jgi:hypothetical protein
MTEYTVSVLAPVDEDSEPETTTSSITWAGTATDLAAHLGARTADKYRGWQTNWSITVEVDGISTEYTDRNEAERIAARHEIVTCWENDERALGQQVLGLCASLGQDVADAAEAGVAELLRLRAADALEEIGYRVVRGADDTVRVVDERTVDGMLSMIRHAERERRTHKEESDLWRDKRNALIRAAHALKETPTRLANAARVSPQRIKQIRDQQPIAD